MARHIIVSYRLPVAGSGAGGLLVALQNALRDDPGLWIGHSGIITDTPSSDLRPMPEASGPRCLGFDLTPEAQAGFYTGFANGVIWPLCHGRADLLHLDRKAAATYLQVNRDLARRMQPLLRAGDQIWIHDYHFLPLAHALRAEGFAGAIGLFLHVPFPNRDLIRCLPDHRALETWLGSFDVLGLQTERDVARATAIFEGRQSPLIFSCPVGIEAQDMAARAAALPDTAKNNSQPKKLIGVDRLDYSKGIPERLRAFEHLLKTKPQRAGGVQLFQIAPPTRSEIEAYRDARHKAERLVAAINGRHATPDWTPIHYLHRNLPRDELIGYYRAAAVGVVTPLADGMNLVAKEYIACQDPENPGVLVLSRFAGAAERLGAALVVNPYDSEALAEAYETALAMPLDERQDRYARLFDVISREDANWWAQSFLMALDGVQLRTRDETWQRLVDFTARLGMS
ncbi:MAG: alpha,alpha-trehalose-phosphate synthase (UDP-forming) [Mangrovicoccus sp.]